MIPAKVVDIRAADLQQMLNVNLFGALHVMQQAVQVMRKQGRGHVVNVLRWPGGAASPRSVAIAPRSSPSWD
jgi:NAD(P)-dependent dehydrogenase (short-subunit alcohol dehydrogenase family)